MRFMIMVPSSSDAEAGVLPDNERFAAMAKYNQALQKAGVLLELAGLHPTSKGALVRFANGKTTTAPGPFAIAENLLAGFWIVETKTKAEAVEWASRAPFGDGVVLQVRQLHDPADFPEASPQAGAK